MSTVAAPPAPASTTSRGQTLLLALLVFLLGPLGMLALWWIRPSLGQTWKVLGSLWAVLYFLVLLLGRGQAAATPSAVAPPPIAAAPTADVAGIVAAQVKATVAAMPTAAPRVALAAAAPAPTAAPTAPGKVGERIVVKGVALTVSAVDHAQTVGKFLAAQLGQTYLVADVTIENTWTDKEPYNPFYFKVKDADGFEYTASPFGADHPLQSGDLSPGDKARGQVVFTVPSAAKGLVLSYEPQVVMGGYEPIRVALGDAAG